MKVFKADEFLNPEENISITKNQISEIELPHTHEFIEFVYIYSGSGKQFINDLSFDVSRGDFLLINYNSVHSFTSSDNMVYINFLLKPEFMSEELLNTENLFKLFSLSVFDEFRGEINQNMSMLSFGGTEILELENLVEYMLAEFQAKKTGYKSILKGYMQVILAKVIRKLDTTYHNKIKGYIHKITPDILKYIDDNCFEKLSLSELAKKCFYNPAYFSRIFKECYGKSLTVYIQEKRMEEAVKLLSGTNIPIEGICEKTGYTDKGQFYKIFKEYTGVTPKKYRENQKIQNK